MLHVLVDTNILIDYSHGKSELLNQLLGLQKKGEAVLYVNPIIIAEYTTDANLEKASMLKDVLEFLEMFSIVDITKKDGLLAGELLRMRSTTSLIDALIAATCIHKKLQLVTRNKKHFSKVAGLEFWKLS